MIKMDDDSLPERVAYLEARMNGLEKEISELKGNVDAMRNDIYSIRNNEINHLRRDKMFWMKVLGAGGAGAIILDRLLSLLLHLLGV